ncbi:MAG: GntR family transcriptional regulator [Rhodobacteraceae bacterium]|nr:GntR family transcriptional regulator [Paracoccaceae bacterium]
MPSAADQRSRLSDDGTPYYVQLAAVIRRQIADQTLNDGDRLPTLKQLVAHYGVSAMTVRHALAQLEDEGLIRAERGRGTFVTAPPPQTEQVPYQLTRSPSLRGNGLSFRVTASHPASGELAIAESEGVAFPRYHYMRRIFSRHGMPFVLGEYLISSGVYASIPETQWTTELISTVLFDTPDVGLTHVRQTFRVMGSTPHEAQALGIRIVDPVVRVRRIFQNAAREVICLAQLVYRTDGVVFDINIDLDDRNRLLELGGFPES